jgi:hypothetical protein
MSLCCVRGGGRSEPGVDDPGPNGSIQHFYFTNTNKQGSRFFAIGSGLLSRDAAGRIEARLDDA